MMLLWLISGIVSILIKVLVWYDNEYGYARRIFDLADYMAKQQLR